MTHQLVSEPIHLHYDEDVVNLVSALGSDTTFTNVQHVPTVSSMLELGVWPESLAIDRSWISDYMLTNMDNSTIEFWHAVGALLVPT